MAFSTTPGISRILPLIDLDLHFLLVREHGEEHVGTDGRQLAVTPDEGKELVRVRHAVELPGSTGAEGVGRYVDQHGLHVLPHLYPGLHAGPERDAQIRIDLSVRLLSQPLRQNRRDPRNTGGAADQQHAVELARAHAGVLQRGGHGLERTVEKRLQIAFEICAGQLAGEMSGLAVHRGDVVLLHAHPGLIRQVDLGAFGRPSQPRLQQAVVTGLLDPQRRLDMGVETFEDERVEIVAAELIVAGGGQHFDHAFLYAHHGDVEGPAAQVVDEEGCGAPCRRSRS